MQYQNSFIIFIKYIVTHIMYSKHLYHYDNTQKISFVLYQLNKNMQLTYNRMQYIWFLISINLYIYDKCYTYI